MRCCSSQEVRDKKVVRLREQAADLQEQLHQSPMSVTRRWRQEDFVPSTDQEVLGCQEDTNKALSTGNAAEGPDRLWPRPTLAQADLSRLSPDRLRPVDLHRDSILTCSEVQTSFLALCFSSRFFFLWMFFLFFLFSMLFLSLVLVLVLFRAVLPSPGTPCKVGGIVQGDEGPIGGVAQVVCDIKKKDRKRKWKSREK